MIKLPGRESAQHSSIADFKNEWSFTSSPAYVFQACTGPFFSLNVLGIRNSIFRQPRWIFRKWEGVVRTGWSWLRIGTGGGHLWIRFLKMRRISWIAENPLASQEGLCCMEWVSKQASKQATLHTCALITPYGRFLEKQKSLKKYPPMVWKPKYHCRIMKISPQS